MRVALRDTIVSFRQKGLEQLYRDGSKKGVQAAHVPKLLRILSLLDVAHTPDEMKTPVHPGEILREDVLADLGLSVGEAASRLGISRVTLSRVLHGHARVSPNLAVRLEEAGVGTARAWLGLQSAHDLAAERAAGLPTVRRLDPVA